MLAARESRLTMAPKSSAIVYWLGEPRQVASRRDLKQSGNGDDIEGNETKELRITPYRPNPKKTIGARHTRDT